MQGKIIVITGATSGIGRVAAEAFARMGERLVLVARDRERGAETLAALERLAPGLGHSIHYADLSLVRDAARVAAEIAAMEPRIDVLVNNAGAVFAHREITAEGNERTFATNHLACFVLTQGLLPRLLASAPARIVTTSSIAHQRATLDFADLQSVRHYGGIRAYSRSKLCNILFTRELARRLSGTGVTATCLHPGFVASRFGDASGGVLREIIAVGKRLLAISPEKGARTLIWLATAPEAASESGGYYYKCRRVTPSAAAQDAVAAERLWAESERLVSAVSP